jgi:hypothetical protein
VEEVELKVEPEVDIKVEARKKERRFVTPTTLVT